MLVLGIDTATPVAGVALVNENGLVASRLVSGSRSHSVRLMPMIRDVLHEGQVQPGDLSGLAVSTGPGSFTGLRIGLVCARTLARIWQLPLAGLSTLEVLAFPFAGSGALVVPMLNARRGEVYAGVYRAGPDRPVCLAGPAAVAPEGLPALLEPFDGPFVAVGDGLPVCRLVLAQLKRDVREAPPVAWAPRGDSLAQLGAILLENGLGTDALAVFPRYIRLPEAEVVWRQKHGGGCD
ncbi:MAG TPA: tRNA (adenosine(37)-N6)-threonylcarbamoyltransferase complex dimerization subunit type 1 TsaB [Spirochaetia bacterium]|nr:tRNA (adenosine(37)-N6)-threonylcarbamoyltransferase complex dimerization subunit type 1 TsaB [Spirochaetia bacterium]